MIYILLIRVICVICGWFSQIVLIRVRLRLIKNHKVLLDQIAR